MTAESHTGAALRRIVENMNPIGFDLDRALIALDALQGNDEFRQMVCGFEWRLFLPERDTWSNWTKWYGITPTDDPLRNLQLHLGGEHGANTVLSRIEGKPLEWADMNHRRYRRFCDGCGATGWMHGVARTGPQVCWTCGNPDELPMVTR